MAEQNKEGMCNETCCKKMSCCGWNSQRASLGRILLWVLILSAVFFWWVKFGMWGMDTWMHGKGGRWGKWGCMMGKGMHKWCDMMKEWGCGMMHDGMMKKEMMPTSSGENINNLSGEAQVAPSPTEEIPAVAEDSDGIQ